MAKRNISFREESLQDASEQADAQSWLPIEIHQISAGQYTGHMRVLEHDDVGVYFESQSRSIHKLGVMDKASCTVSFFRKRQSMARFSEYTPTDNSLFFLSGGTEFDIQVPANVETVYFRFDQSSLLDMARAMSPARWERLPAGLQILDLADRNVLDELSSCISACASFGERSSMACDDGSLARVITEQILAALNSERSESGDALPGLIARRRARSLVNQVIEYTKAKMDENSCPGIGDICHDLSVSERAVQYSFKAVLGLSPNAYLRYLRLNRVRTALMRPVSEGETVTRVALRWHFLHLGRFSSDYQQVFDELPSATLRRSLGQSFVLRK